MVTLSKQAHVGERKNEFSRIIGLSEAGEISWTAVTQESSPAKVQSSSPQGSLNHGHEGLPYCPPRISNVVEELLQRPLVGVKPCI